MAISPFKSKYDAMPAYKGKGALILRSLKDGGLKRFVVDQPALDQQSAETPQSGSANALLQLAKRVDDPMIDGDQVHIYVFDGVDKDGKALPLPKLWDRRINQWVSPPRMTEHHRKVMEFFVSHRNEIEIRAAEMLKNKRDASSDRANEGVEQVLAALGDRMTKAPKKQAALGGAP